MTLRQNKVAIRLGNFVFHGDDYGIIIKRMKPLSGMYGRSSVYQVVTS